MTSRLLTAILHRGGLFALVWAVLTGAEPGGIALGVLVVPAAVALSLALLPARSPLRLWRLALHLPRFLAGSVAGGLDVARRAFAPSLPLRPGWIAVPVALPDGARVALGGELSLMPGTLAAGVDDGRLLVHLLDVEGGFDAAIPGEIASIARIVDAPGAAGGPGGPAR